LFPSPKVTVHFDRAKDNSTVGSGGIGKVHREGATPVWAVDPHGKDVSIKTVTRFYFVICEFISFLNT